jgi:transposase
MTNRNGLRIRIRCCIPRGVPRVNDRCVLNGVLWILCSSAPWRDLPNAFGPYNTSSVSRKIGSNALADRGYDADWIRAHAAERGVWANIAPHCNRTKPICFSPYLYRARNLVERFFNKIKQCRRVATRCDRLAANYLAFVQLASTRLWLRVNKSAPYSVVCLS